MPMNAGTAGIDGLANELYVALDAAFGADPDIDNDRKTFCDVVAATVIAHITANAKVSTFVDVTSVSGVTTGGGVSGPGSGAGSGTVA